MRQSKLMSLLEAIIGTTLGFLVALLTQLIVFPLYNIEVSIVQNLEISSIFTFVSLVRVYVVRRIFNRIPPKETNGNQVLN